VNVSNLNRLFETMTRRKVRHSAFYGRNATPQDSLASGFPVLCVDQNRDVLAYLRELLTHRGHQVHMTSRLADALILVRATCPALLILGPSLTGSPSTREAFQTACTRVPGLELESDFSTQDAGEAAPRLLESIQAHLQPNRDFS